MAEVMTYPDTIHGVLDYLRRPLTRIPKPGVETLLLEDARREQFVLMRVGWHDGRRVNNIVAHIRIKDGKVWIENDMTDADVAGRLLAAGVPRGDIVLAFHPPELRHLTEFAPA